MSNPDCGHLLQVRRDIGTDSPIVIVGSGLAGYGLARELRKLDAEIPLVLITKDAGYFYKKPMLSNALAEGHSTASLALKSAVDMATELRMDILSDTEVVAIDLQSRCVRLQGDMQQPYGALVLALGADPVRPGLQGSGAGDVLTVNDLEGYTAFERAVSELGTRGPARQVLIMGAGLIGCEFANDLVTRGFRPVVVDLADRALERLLPQEASQRLQDALISSGVSFRFNASVIAVERCNEGFAVKFQDGSVEQVGLVLSAIGLKPRTGLAAQAGLAVARGIVTEATLTTSDSRVFALGDCVEMNGSVLSYVMPITYQVRALASTLVGKPASVVYPVMPVKLKTPACPTVLCVPPPQSRGGWVVDATAEGLEAVFVDAASSDRALGFALQGAAVSKRQKFVNRISG